MTWEELLRALAILGLGGAGFGAGFAFILQRYVEHRLARQLERYRVTLSQLHHMRATAIAELYYSVVEAEQDLRDWIYKDMPVGLAPPDVNVADVLSRLRLLRVRAEKTRILLSEDGWKPIGDMMERLDAVAGQLERREIFSRDEAAKDEAHAAALGGLNAAVHGAKARLEHEFRLILGAA